MFLLLGMCFFPFDTLFPILRRNPSYRSDECWMNAIACIFSVATSLGFSTSAEYDVSQVIVEPFVILGSDIIDPSSNQIPHSL